MTEKTTTKGDRHGGAIFSLDGRYRYVLWRRWRYTHRGRVLFVMLNPSTANETEDDATIRRCTAYARSWDYDGLAVCNLYAWRSTKPHVLLNVPDPVGPLNGAFLKNWTRASRLVVCAWGAHGTARGRLIHPLLSAYAGHQLYVLGLTRDGTPRHPLMLRKALQPVLWTPAAS